MDPNDLLKLLDLDGKPPAAPAVSGVVIAPAAGPTPMADAGPTALEVDAWGLRRGRDLVAESPRLRDAGTGEHAAADFFCAGFDPDPRLRESCADPRRHRYLAQLLDTPEYRALHAATHLDDTAAGIAAAHFAEQFAALEREAAAGAAPGAGDGLAVEMATLRAVGRAVAAAGTEVTELHEAAGALGMGPGMPGANNPAAVAALFRQVRGDPALRRICDLAGRFRRVAQSKQRMKATHGLDDVVGVEPGGDVGRLLPSELVRLMVPELELDTLRRIVERQALCREHHAVEPAGKGPVVVCLDESGSMSGEKIHTAKALALALAWVARSQRRWCALVAYSGDSGERLLPLPPGRWDEARLLDWLAAFIGRGSEIDIPVRELPRMVADLKAPPGVTDVVFVTDAKCRLPADVREAFLAWKQSARVRLVTLVIENAPGDLAGVCDEVHVVRSLGPDGDAVGRVLSL
ncbi:hypothetical protein [Urbifossiella limnaea]|uniref:VWA domain-containing protein n=1 Tax=Urbifossiella limnaea TaxID=2528023 RepID=A0A517XQG8_9BACT|nr:hypothetical protein [Urbifossiella limnaea]QDU19743.1 hypothetical protein ETAA1_16790 [Urbifossiella limnaea]